MFVKDNKACQPEQCMSTINIRTNVVIIASPWILDQLYSVIIAKRCKF